MNAQEALAEYRKALADWTFASTDILDKRRGVDERKRTLDEIEAEVLVNGGAGEVVIDGKNAETRNAQLTLALKGHRPYQRAAEDCREARQWLEDTEAVRDAAAETMRLCRAVLALATAEANERAYAHGGDNGK